jgi:hypothetical protein
MNKQYGGKKKYIEKDRRVKKRETQRNRMKRKTD